jgi:hypothetical protein
MKWTNDPIELSMMERDIELKYGVRFSDWIEEKRMIGKKKRNRIDRRKRRIQIKKKQLGLIR